MKLSSFFVAQASASAVFRLFDEPKTFKDAEKACESRSATLAYFNDNDEYADFKKAVGNKDFVWTGISRGPGGHIWRRPDGQIADIIPWNPHEPNGSGNNENCVERRYDDLNDRACNTKNPFVCRWQKEAEFVVYNKWANFKDAENFCHAKGGTLPFFTSPFQWFDFSTLLKYKGASHAWLGVKRCGANSWMAVDNTPENKLFLKWHRNEPNNGRGKEDCVEVVNSHHGLNDIGCHYARQVVCRFEVEHK